MKKELFTGSIAVAEESRDKTPYTGFLSGLFENTVRWPLFFDRRLPAISDEEVAFITALRNVLQKGRGPEAVDALAEILDGDIDALKKIGAFGIKIKKEYGGLELSQSAYQRVAVLLGSWCASTTVLISAHNSIGIPEPVKLFGTPRQKKEFLSRAALGELSAFALTEKNVGCDISKVETYAVRTYKQGRVAGYRITGEKCFITNATKTNGKFLARLLVVIARIVDHPDEMSDPKARRYYGAFVVDTKSPGLSVRKLYFEGVRGIANGMPKFDGVDVPVENRLGSETDGLKVALSTLTVGRLTLPAACLGGMKQCLWLSRSWATQRKQWNKPVGEHTLVGEKIVRMAARTLALEAITAACGIWADTKNDVRLESAASKILGSEWHWEAVNDAFQVKSGRSFAIPESQMMIDGIYAPMGRMLRDARINLIWEGTSEILRVWLGREGMAQYINWYMNVMTGSISERFAGAGELGMAFIASFLPKLSAPRRFRRTPLFDEMCFIETACRTFARTLMQTLKKHKKKLEVKQLILKEFIDESMLLFALSALIWYVSLPEVEKRPLAIELAKFFAREVVEKISPPATLKERTLKSTKDSEVYALAKRLLAGDAEWLEDGIMKINQ